MNDIANDIEQFLLKGDWKKDINMGGEAEYVSLDGDLQVIVTAQNAWRLGSFTDTDVDGVATGRFKTIAEGDEFRCLLDAITAATENLTCDTCDCRILPGESWETFGDAPYHENPGDCVAAIREQHRIELSKLQAQRDALKYMFDSGLAVDAITNEDEPNPTIWLTGNMPLDLLNTLRKAAGLTPMRRSSPLGEL